MIGDEELAPPAASRVEVHVPASTILRVLFALAAVWLLLRIIPSLVVLVIAVLLGVTIAPAVGKLEQRGLSRRLGVALVSALIVAGIALLVFLVVPPLAAQTVALVDNFHTYQRDVETRLGPQHPLLARLASQVFRLSSSPDIARMFNQPLAWGQIAVEGLVLGGLVLVLALYLLVDGRRTYAWLLAYVPRHHRHKMALTVPAVSDVVTAYVQGQLLTSLLCGSFTLAVLMLLHVPSAIPLAVLAAVLDVVPIIGIFLSTVPAAFFALTVSPWTALAVIALYLGYHALENYVIIPRVYGKRLRLTTLVVLVALMVGASIYGVVGAVLILPFVAAYPIIEKIWLQDYLRDEVVADHRVLEKAAGDGGDGVVEAVLKGRPHASEKRGRSEDPREKRTA